MRLDFNLLWVEDQPERVEAQRTRIEMLMRKQGFKLQVEVATSIKKAEAFIGDDVFGDHIDLVLMDFDFGGDPDGEYGLGVVRETFPYKDIVFYSAMVPQDLEDIVARLKLPGVFCCHRNDLPDTVIGVFEALVKKVLDIDHSRGIVMGATSEIDGFVNQALLHVFSQADPDSRAAALKVVTGQLVEIRKRFERDCQIIEGAKELSDLLPCHATYSSAHRLRLFRKILKILGIHDKERETMLSYAKETMPKRNDLAHVTVKRSGFSRKIFDREGKELTAEDMRLLRVALLDHHELFEKLVPKPDEG